MRRAAVLAATMLALLARPVESDVSPAIPSDSPAIALPQDNDEYSRLVAKAAAHDPDTDFRALRFAWLDSKARERHIEISLRSDVNKMVDAVRANDHQAVRDRATTLLSEEYVSIMGQLYLRVSCQDLGDQSCAGQADFVGRGLVQSIFKTGDGKTCETGWEVAMVEEEYAILRIFGLPFKQQALIMSKNGGHSCDAMTVSDKDGKDLVYYFTIDRVMADEMKMLSPKKP
jgi:hypothetical protein